MNTKFAATAVLAIATLTSAGAFAQSQNQNQNHLYGEAAQAIRFDTGAGQLSRADVRADYVQARKNGLLALNPEAGLVQAAGAATSTTRAEVRAQAMGWAKAHRTEAQSAS